MFVLPNIFAALNSSEGVKFWIRTWQEPKEELEIMKALDKPQIQRAD